MRIRPFRHEDIDAVMHLVDRTLEDRYTPDFFLGLWEVAPQGFLVAEKAGKVVGFILGVLADVGTLRILMVCVAPEHRRQGIASTLLEQVTAVHQPEVVCLEVKTSNAQAIRLYQRHGFVITEMLPDFYPDGSSAYRMEKRLH